MTRFLSALLPLLPLTTAINFDCSHVRTGGTSYNLHSLGGPRSLSQTTDSPPTISNTTFTFDICQPLTKTKDLPDAEQCLSGTRFCAVERDTNTAEDKTYIRRVISVAGEFAATNGRAMDPKVERLRKSGSHSDRDRDGIRVEFHGGRYPDKKGGREQMAVVEFECDAGRRGDEEGKGEERRWLRRKEGEDKGKEGEGKDEEGKDEEAERSLRLVSYREEEDRDVLRISWRTKYACEDVADEEGESKGRGFFGWLFIIIFLGIAAYIIFGSWLNYSRYGARGWDLLPHGDTVRELPYILKDWARSVIDTVQGRGYRGGYSAV